MTKNSAAQTLRQSIAKQGTTDKAQAIADDFVAYLNEFHTYDQPYDDRMDAELHEQYARILREQSKWGYFDFNSRPFFSPSSAGRCDRELYEKVRNSPKDKRAWQPQQRRWTALGGAVGDLIQREIMLAERHYKKFTGKEPRFRFARTERGEPCFEHFTKKMHEIEHDGEKFAIFGLGDGILEYTDEETGEVLRVGLEVKSKQQSYADTSERRLQRPNLDHSLQTVCYSEMYGIDYFIILYVNTAKKAWNMTDDDRRKSPDIRAFGAYITQQDRNNVLDKFAEIVRRVREEDAPLPDLSAWKFNEYKTTIAQGLTDEEVEQLRKTAERAQKSGLQDWQKRSYAEAIEEIESIREGLRKEK